MRFWSSIGIPVLSIFSWVLSRKQASMSQYKSLTNQRLDIEFDQQTRERERKTYLGTADKEARFLLKSNPQYRFSKRERMRLWFFTCRTHKWDFSLSPVRKDSGFNEFCVKKKTPWIYPSSQHTLFIKNIFYKNIEAEIAKKIKTSLRTSPASNFGKQFFKGRIFL